MVPNCMPTVFICSSVSVAMVGVSSSCGASSFPAVLVSADLSSAFLSFLQAEKANSKTAMAVINVIFFILNFICTY